MADLKKSNPQASNAELKPLFLQEIFKRLDEDPELEESASVQTQPVPPAQLATPPMTLSSWMIYKILILVSSHNLQG